MHDNVQLCKYLNFYFNFFSPLRFFLNGKFRALKFKQSFKYATTVATI